MEKEREKRILIRWVKRKEVDEMRNTQDIIFLIWIQKNFLKKMYQEIERKKKVWNQLKINGKKLKKEFLLIGLMKQ